MKRWLVRIFVFLLLGAIVNVAVAWGCSLAATPTPPPGYTSSQSVENLREFLYHWNNVGHDRWEQIYTFRYLEDGTEPARPGLPRVVLESGWPRRAMSCRAYGTAATSQADASGVLVGFETRISIQRSEEAIPLRPDALAETYSSWRALPLRPLWPGFAINTVFYAGVLCLLFVTPFALRRRRRIKRGLCPKCAYPVGTNEVCTECGAPELSGSTGGGTHNAVNR